MIFDPVKMREIADEALARIRNTEFEDSRPMGNVAIMQLGEIIRLWLVGLDVESREVLPRLLNWIEYAVDKNEQFGGSRNFHLMNLHVAAAICKWMIFGKDDVEHWDKARLFNGLILPSEGVYGKRDYSAWRVDEYLAYANLSEQYALGIVEFEKYWSLDSIGNGTLNPRQFGYVSCLHLDRGCFDRETLFKAGRKLLKKYMQEQWLGGGQYVYATLWLKMVYRYEGADSLSPAKIILKAYENMPDVSKPLFLNAV